MSIRNPYDNGLNLTFIMENLKPLTVIDDIDLLVEPDLDTITGWSIALNNPAASGLSGITAPSPARWVTKHIYVVSTVYVGQELKIKSEDTDVLVPADRIVTHNDAVNNMYVHSIAPIVYDPDIERWVLAYERS